MLIALVILGLLAVLILCLFHLPAQMGVEYERKKDKQRLIIKCRIFGIPLTFHIPLHKEKNKQKKDVKRGRKQDNKEKKSLTPRSFIKSVKMLWRAYQESKANIKEVLGDLKKALCCTEMRIRVHYGMKNPAVTGMLNGAMWTAGSLLLKMADTAIGVQKKELVVQPDFTKEFMCLYFCGTLQFKPVDLLKIVLKLNKLVNLIKSKTEN